MENEGGIFPYSSIRMKNWKFIIIAYAMNGMFSLNAQSTVNAMNYMRILSNLSTTTLHVSSLRKTIFDYCMGGMNIKSFR